MKLLVEFLHKKGFLVNVDSLDLNQFSLEGETPLMVAVRENDLRMVIEILKHGADKLEINAKRYTDGVTSLMLAVKNNYLDIVQELLDVQTLDVNAQNGSGKTALYIGAEFGLRMVVLEILESQKHVVYDLESFQKKDAYNVALEHRYFNIAEDINRMAKIPDRSPLPSGMPQEHSEMILPSYNLYSVAYTNFLKADNQNISSLEHLKNEGIYLVQDLKNTVEQLALVGAKPGEHWFLVYKKKIKAWGHSVNRYLKEKRDENVKSDQSFIFDFNKDLNRNDQEIFQYIQALWKLSIEAYEQSSALLGSMVPNQLKGVEEVEELENKTILSLVSLQTLVSICTDMESKTDPNSPLSNDLKAFLSSCESGLMGIQQNLENAYCLNMHKCAEMEQRLTLIDDVENNFKFFKTTDDNSPIKFSVKREEALLRRNAYHEYVVILLKRIRLGLFPKQQQALLRNTQKMIHKFKKMLFQEDFPRLDWKNILELKNDTIGFDVDLLQAWSNRAHRAGIGLMLSMLMLQETALTEQLSFFYNQIQFLREFYAEFNIKCFFGQMDHGFLKKCPLYFSISTLFPKGSDYYALYFLAIFEKNITEPIIEEGIYEIEMLNSELADIEKEISEHKQAVEKFEVERSSLELQRTAFLAKKEKLCRELMRDKFSGIDGSYENTADEDFSLLYKMNDRILESAESELDCVTSQLESVSAKRVVLESNLRDALHNKEEVFGSFQPFAHNMSQSERECQSFFSQLGSCVDKYNSLKGKKEELEVKVKNVARKNKITHEEIIVLEDEYFANQNVIDELDANIEDLQALISDCEEQRDNTMFQKQETQERLDINNQYYLHLLQITQRIHLQKTLLGQEKELENEDLRDISDMAKENAQIELENACKRLVEVVVKGCGDIWHQEPLIMLKNLQKLPGRMQEDNCCLVKKLIESFMKSEYSRQYIGAKISEITKLFEVLEAPFKALSFEPDFKVNDRKERRLALMS